MVSTTARIFQLDAFATKRFAGNPAAVVVLEHFLEDRVLQAIAAENNVSETAFLVAVDNDYALRWFTAVVEVPLCGHATLASAAVVMERLDAGRTEVRFRTASGSLRVERRASRYAMDFPARLSVAVAPDALERALGAPLVEARVNEYAYLAQLQSAAAVRSLRPDMAVIAALDRPGLVVTAEADGEYDFVSRYFAPARGVPEDPVTGTAHCMLTPFWSERLDKREFRAFQASTRGGEVHCSLIDGDRVELAGSCVFYLEGRVAI